MNAVDLELTIKLRSSCGLTNPTHLATSTHIDNKYQSWQDFCLLTEENSETNRVLTLTVIRLQQERW